VPADQVPTKTTIHRILERHGRVRPWRRSPRRMHPGAPGTPMEQPNAVWTADFKGQFRTGNGVYCYPLTVQDGATRFLLGCRGLLGPTTEGSWPVFERLFRRYGLPERIRTDNGQPFASNALGRLSTLSVWWVRLGIPARADRARASGAEWPARADAQNAEGRDGPSPASALGQPAALLRSLPRALQHRAPA
jgi:transposase InsO family protein